MCSFARRSAPSASRICGCGSAGVAVVAGGSALAAGTAAPLALFGAAGVEAMKANARTEEATARRHTILVFMNHSSRPNFGSDGRFCLHFSVCNPAAKRTLCPATGHAPLWRFQKIFQVAKPPDYLPFRPTLARSIENSRAAVPIRNGQFKREQLLRIAEFA
jgi:hypothetical protein